MDAETNAHPCPLMNNNIAPMPTQNPWVWVGMGMSMGMGTQCRALEHLPLIHLILKKTWPAIWVCCRFISNDLVYIRSRSLRVIMVSNQLQKVASQLHVVEGFYVDG